MMDKIKYGVAYIVSGLLFWTGNGLHYVVNWCYFASEKLEDKMNVKVNWL